MKGTRTVSIILASFLLFHSVAHAATPVKKEVTTQNSKKRKPSARIERKNREYHSSRVLQSKEIKRKKASHKGVLRKIPEDYAYGVSPHMERLNKIIRFFGTVAVILFTGYLIVHADNGTGTVVTPAVPVTHAVVAALEDPFLVQIYG
ncbi:hypothetical protein CLAVI_000541 [Candidatus Clavichlamydia salmonicola]|uniref:hypothetical protein n=1 Tax=Candidatus Clavichlamydia salmonicola TaxID=469812 RepID=UPI001890BE98|nr:hypothetical protein [Candidatus Clavichlamydia salmonicola]MBF5050919.1 hypothetical protein [Candidatus Clavichlamydia salmonicola]